MNIITKYNVGDRIYTTKTASVSSGKIRIKTFRDDVVISILVTSICIELEEESNILTICYAGTSDKPSLQSSQDFCFEKDAYASKSEAQNAYDELVRQAYNEQYGGIGKSIELETTIGEGGSRE